jgi:formylglycine-generating enzyme required for sulfatase activity
MIKRPIHNPKSTRQFMIALGVVLGGVSFGSLIVLRTDVPGRSQRPLAPASAMRTGSSWTNNMEWIPGGHYWMGSEDGHPDEQPVHQITVSGFWMDKTEVTNEQFEQFVKASGYVTMAERKPDSKDFLDVPLEMLVPGSLNFNPPPGEVSLENHYIWWKWTPGANWRHPEGPGSELKGREKHPVVHVCWYDAMAYADWADKRLPTEAEWEFASRGGLEHGTYSWGDNLIPGGNWQANIWQGKFPHENTRDDGFLATAPVATFSPNGYGLYDMAGNVWEWCSDWYRPDYYTQSPKANPLGPVVSFDPNEPSVPKRIMRGGSYLCSDLYCTGYRPSARMKSSPDKGLSHTGFRCVKDGSAPER